MIHRRAVVAGLVARFLTMPRIARGQTTRPVTIGWLAFEPVQSDFEPFQKTLGELGYVEGRNLAIEQRYAGVGQTERFGDLAVDLVRRKVDVLVATGAAARAAQKATATIPIVFFVGNPIAEGLVPSLSHPGGNLTGFASLAVELSGKRVELFREAVPGMVRLAVMTNNISLAGQRSQWQSAEAAARQLGIQLIPSPLDVRKADDLDRSFAIAVKERVGGVLVVSSVFFNAQRQRIVSLAAKTRIPTIYYQREFVEAGGLMSYGPDNGDVYRRAAVYVDKILKGAKPGDLPIQQPTKFDLVINLKTAKALGLTIPPAVLARADEVIR